MGWGGGASLVSITSTYPCPFVHPSLKSQFQIYILLVSVDPHGVLVDQGPCHIFSDQKLMGGFVVEGFFCLQVVTFFNFEG